MGLIIRPDDIGQLSEAAGTFTLGASRLTVGGQQYVTPAVQVTPAGLVAETLYRVYAVVSSGVVAIVESTNNVASGPAGFDAWLLIGHFWFSVNSNIRVVTPAVDGKFANLPPVNVKVFRSVTQNVGTANAQTLWDSVAYDNWDVFGSGGNDFTVPISTKYAFNLNLNSSNLGGNDRVIGRIRVDGADFVRIANGGDITNIYPTGGGNSDRTKGEAITSTSESNSDNTWGVAGGVINAYLEMYQLENTGLVRDEDL